MLPSSEDPARMMRYAGKHPDLPILHIMQGRRVKKQLPDDRPHILYTYQEAMGNLQLTAT